MRHDDPARAALHFADATRAAFRFLESLGLQELDADTTIVRYASTRVFLNVYHGRSSYELGVEIGLGDATQGQSGHGMSELIRLVDKDEGHRFRNTTATTPEEVRDGVQKLAEQTKRYGHLALKGDASVFAALDMQRRQWAEEYAAEVTYRQILPEAQEAFRKHEYVRAAQLYERIQNNLGPVDLKKLAYARKHG
jgi:hypothetical protein